MLPREGFATRVVLHDIDRWVWWGPEDEYSDVLAVEDGGVVTFTRRADLARHAESQGWRPAAFGEHSELDLRRAERWIRRRGGPAPAVALLDLWNLANDICDSVGAHDVTSGATARRINRKLFAAAVPWFFAMDAYEPRWSPYELVRLRMIGLRSLRLVRQHVGGRPTTPSR